MNDPSSLSSRTQLSQALNSIERVRVLMHGEQVGTLVMTKDGALAFEYSAAWIAHGFSISPLSLPLRAGVFVAPLHPLDGVFGVFDDSLPDGWGRLLVDRALRQQGFDPNSLNALARLSIVGSGGMGALEYEPETPLPTSRGGIDLDQIAEACARFLENDCSDDLDALFTLGGSSGGARPKILTTVDGEPWIIKFASSGDPHSIGEDEYRIACVAKACGIHMPEVRLFPSSRCSGYFGAKRFDRIADGSNIRKIHMASAGALLETSHRIPNLDYRTLMQLTWRITDNAADVELLYRLMCFNVFIGNRDDHSKNFSYLYDEENSAWRLAPAYDLTTNPGMYGERATTVNGKGKDISLVDLCAIGIGAGIAERRARSIALDIQELVREQDLLDKE